MECQDKRGSREHNKALLVDKVQRNRWLWPGYDPLQSSTSSYLMLQL